MTIELPLAILHELIAHEQLPRTPEPELVMDAVQTVEDYSSCGEEGGALYGPYLLNALQVSARLRPGDRVLDLGCASGRLLNLIARWNPAVSFTGVDLAPQMLALAREQAAQWGLTNVSYREGDFSTLDDIGANEVDAVVSSMALHHLPDRAALTRCFASIKRVLRREGALYLMDFGRLRSKRAVEIFVAKVARTETESLSQDYRASLHAAFTPQDFAAEIAGLEHPGTSLYCTVIAPLVVVVCTPLPVAPLQPAISSAYRASLPALGERRLAELNQLHLFLRLGGLEFPR